MPKTPSRTGTKKSTTRKRAAKKSAAKKKTARSSRGLPRINLTTELAEDLYAAGRYLDKSARDKLHLRIPFDVILQDPMVLVQNRGLAKDDEYRIAWEPGLTDGPTSARFAIVDYNADTGRLVPPARWDAARRRYVKGRKALGTDDIDEPQFHQVNVWAILQDALEFFEDGFGLGRPIPWGFEGNRLTVVPHAGQGENAFYDRKSKSLQFYYFGAEDDRVYTCLSADIIHHELAHAILDGVRPYYSQSPSVQTGAFHEFMGDISAILLSLRNTKFRRGIARETDGNLRAATNLASIAEQFGQRTKGRPYLRKATSRAKMHLVAGQTSVHLVSEVLTATMFKILLKLTERYLQREKDRIKARGLKRKPSVNSVFSWAYQRWRRIVIQPLDFLPPVDVNFRDYALAVLRAHQLAEPLDPNNYTGLMLDVFISRGILDESDRAKVTATDRHLYDRERLRIYHDIGDISRSRAAAYRFLHDNRAELYIPLGTDFTVADLYDANKYARAGIRQPRQVVLEYVWKEDVTLDDSRFGRFKGQVTTLLCGGTIAFDGKGNIISWARKPGTGIAADEERLGRAEKPNTKVAKAWYRELEDGRQRRREFLDELANRIARGQIGLAAPESQKGMVGSRVAPLTAEAHEGTVQFALSPHLKIADEDPDEDSGERRWQMSF